MCMAVDNAEVASKARVAVYTHSILRVKRRHDLKDGKIAAIWLECGLPQQQVTLIYCVEYRQWQLLGQVDTSSSSVTDKWEAALLEGK